MPFTQNCTRIEIWLFIYGGAERDWGERAGEGSVGRLRAELRKNWKSVASGGENFGGGGGGGINGGNG